LDITPPANSALTSNSKTSESESTGVPNVEFWGGLPSNSRGPWITAVVWTAETVPLDRGVGDREQGEENTFDVDRAGLSRVGDVQIRALDVKGGPLRQAGKVLPPACAFVLAAPIAAIRK
jgi:hypothetical protein